MNKFIFQKRLFSSINNIFNKKELIEKISYFDIVQASGTGGFMCGVTYGMYFSGEKDLEIPETILASSMFGFTGFITGIGITSGILPVGYGIYYIGKLSNKK